jgi:site-specific recombinase XerD
MSAKFPSAILPLSFRLIIRAGNEVIEAMASFNPSTLSSRTYFLTYASRNGVPLEVVSKVILRHQDLKTTQVYLGKISDSEAIRWMDILHGK